MKHTDRYTIFAVVISIITFTYLFALIIFVVDLKDAVTHNKETLDKIEKTNVKYEYLLDKRMRDIEDTDVQIFLENHKIKAYDFFKSEV